MEKTLKTYALPDGEIERIEILSGFSWEDVAFVNPPFTRRAVAELARLYRCAIMKTREADYGTVVFFRLPPDTSLPLPHQTEDGMLFDLQARGKAYFEGLWKRGEVDSSLSFRDKAVEKEFSHLREEGCICVERGTKKNDLLFLPVSDTFGFLSEMSRPYPVVNSSFFLMDYHDCDSPYDTYGTPYGMQVSRGVMTSPPLNGREALAVDDGGRVSIIHPSFRDFSVRAGGVLYADGKDGVSFHGRPGERVTPPHGGTDIVIVGSRVAALHDGGCTVIPMAGFVISSPRKVCLSDTDVAYEGFGSTRFAIQVGPALLDGGRRITSLVCPFYHPGDPVYFPPTVYPQSFDTGRAGRIGLGAYPDGSPALIWAEAAAFTGHAKGKESAGLALSEFAGIGEALGLRDLVNLDGGGSSQIVWRGVRDLHLKDRDDNGREAERPVPAGLQIRAL